MEKELKIKINVDTKTGAIKVINSDFKTLNKTITNSSKRVQNFQNRLKDMIHMGVGIYTLKKAFDVATGSLTKLTEVAINFWDTTIYFKDSWGDSKKAQESFKWISQFTANTPYDLKNVGYAFLEAKS